MFLGKMTSCPCINLLRWTKTPGLPVSPSRSATDVVCPCGWTVSRQLRGSLTLGDKRPFVIFDTGGLPDLLSELRLDQAVVVEHQKLSWKDGDSRGAAIYICPSLLLVSQQVSPTVMLGSELARWDTRIRPHVLCQERVVSISSACVFDCSSVTKGVCIGQQPGWCCHLPSAAFRSALGGGEGSRDTRRRYRLFPPPPFSPNALL